jgi:ketosteroid isomerase-like protein
MKLIYIRPAMLSHRRDPHGTPALTEISAGLNKTQALKSGVHMEISNYRDKGNYPSLRWQWFAARLRRFPGIFLLLIASFQAGADELKQQVMDTEKNFAASMARRDFSSFREFLSAETVFFSGGEATRGKDAVAANWKSLFDKPDAPFSWEPEEVEVLDSGSLALSSGPVRNAKGELIATFTSIWRLEAPGVWRIIFDKGNAVCRDKQP